MPNQTEEAHAPVAAKGSEPRYPLPSGIAPAGRLQVATFLSVLAILLTIVGALIAAGMWAGSVSTEVQQAVRALEQITHPSEGLGVRQARIEAEMEGIRGELRQINKRLDTLTTVILDQQKQQQAD